MRKQVRILYASHERKLRTEEWQCYILIFLIRSWKTGRREFWFSFFPLCLSNSCLAQKRWSHSWFPESVFADCMKVWLICHVYFGSFAWATEVLGFLKVLWMKLYLKLSLATAVSKWKETPVCVLFNMFYNIFVKLFFMTMILCWEDLHIYSLTRSPWKMSWVVLGVWWMFDSFAVSSCQLWECPNTCSRV